MEPSPVTGSRATARLARCPWDLSDGLFRDRTGDRTVCAFRTSLTRLTRGFKPNRVDKRAKNAPGRIRTCGLALRRRALYPLSYGRGEHGV